MIHGDMTDTAYEPKTNNRFRVILPEETESVELTLIVKPKCCKLNF